MVRSMTGYGRSQKIIDGRDVTVEIRSVNHRYFECATRTPRAYGYLDEKIKSFLQGKIARGKVDVNITVLTLEGKDAEVEVNHALARSYVEALRGLSETLGLPDDLSLSALLRLGDLFTVRKTPEDEAVIWEEVRTVAEEAVAGFLAMREREGERLVGDLLGKLDTIERLVSEVEARSPQTVVEYRERLTQKMLEVLADQKIDEARILTEAAVYAERIAVDEETVRLHSHLEAFREMLLHADQPIGRKLDFMIQEINRETNTIGSKASDLAIGKVVVEIKSEIEKIREQIQNIE